MLEKPLTITQKESAGYDLLPEDVYHVELFDINQEEKPTFDTRNNPPEEQKLETVLNFQFICLDGENRMRYIFANFVPTYFYISKKNGKNKLYRIVEGLLGRELTQDDYMVLEADATKFLNSLIGKQCRVVIEHKKSGDNTYANPVNYMKANSLLTALNKEEKTKILEAKQKSEENKDKEEIRVEDIDF